MFIPDGEKWIRPENKPPATLTPGATVISIQVNITGSRFPIMFPLIQLLAARGVSPQLTCEKIKQVCPNWIQMGNFE